MTSLLPHLNPPIN